ncbi:uncharacterized protein LOC115733630 isoform X1 [Rhodamnia argentea]|uniref:Uncharacterized protein LOC115733630 isoform X1 n=1 Tax=Rhodamnia argentea TaxID=178133 RepID=A0ABM3H6T3_9MYRT|nr:uncharacterized protein LOC115733630 isoform X1 [Rhodamnia argentea]
MEEAEAVMKIFDRCWFELEIFKKRPDTSPSSTSGSDPGQQSIGGIPEDENPCIHLSRAPSILVRSMSDQTSIIPTSFPSSSLSPDSVLCTTPMHSMIYEEEEGFNWNNPRSSEFSRGKKGHAGGRAKRRSLSKSLSQLEFEELKGFTDLGFVFSEEDIDDSSLVSIIPGLQRLGKRIKDDGEEDGDHHQEDGDEKESVGESAVIARPYLSEAWEWWEEKRKEDPLMNWKVPALGNETDMRESLKWWAHTVASTVR